MSKELLRLMADKESRVAQLMDFREALVKIGLGDPETPGQKASRAVLAVIQKWKTAT
jgi:hypothetical protein